MAEYASSSITFRAERLLRVHSEEIILHTNLECIAPTHLQSEECFREVTNVTMNALASTLARQAGKEKGNHRDRALYVLSPQAEECAKVGICFDPVSRLGSINCGRWDRVSIAALLWVVEGDARDLEQRVLTVAEQAGHEVRNEWIGRPSDEVVRLCLTVAAASQFKIANSEMWMRNRSHLMKARNRLDDRDRCLISDIAEKGKPRSSLVYRA